MLYCDQRSQERREILSEKIDPLHFYEITGHRISAFLFHRETDVGKETRTGNLCTDSQDIWMRKDYINYRLCGTIATDPSDASGNQCLRFEPLAMEWRNHRSRGLDLLFPEVRSSIDVIGEVTNEAARETGLLAGTPVICGGGDGSCAE